MKTEKSYSPVKSGMAYTVTSRYYVPKPESELFFYLSNTKEKRNICITKIILSSAVKTIWDIRFDEIYVGGGVAVPLIPLHRGKAELVDNTKGIYAISLDRNNYSPIKKVGEAKPGLYKVTPAYSEVEILKGDEIILSNENSLCIYTRVEGGATAPVNCEIRFYLE